MRNQGKMYTCTLLRNQGKMALCVRVCSVCICTCVCCCLHVVLFVCLKSSSQRCKVHLYVDNKFMGWRKVNRCIRSQPIHLSLRPTCTCTLCTITTCKNVTTCKYVNTTELPRQLSQISHLIVHLMNSMYIYMLFLPHTCTLSLPLSLSPSLPPSLSTYRWRTSGQWVFQMAWASSPSPVRPCPTSSMLTSAHTSGRDTSQTSSSGQSSSFISFLVGY